MRIGYARVSTTDQNLELQLIALKQAGCARIYQEKISGSQRERPELQKLLDQLRSNDIVVVWKLDRLARSTQHLLELVELIRTANASFCSLSEPWADTTSHSGKMIMTVFAGIAEFERELMFIDYWIILSDHPVLDGLLNVNPCFLIIKSVQT